MTNLHNVDMSRFVSFDEIDPHIDGLALMSPIQKLLARQKFIQTKNNCLIVKPWTDTPSEWETTLFGLSAAKVNRTNLIKSCILQKMPSEQIDSIQARWMAGELDSVSLTTASCGGAWIECTPSIRYRVSRSTFKSAPGLLDEVDVPSEFADVGRRTLNLSDVRDRKVDSYIGLRAKIPGNRFVKVITHEGAFLRGFKDIPVPKNFGIEVAEFYMGKFFIVYPYYSKAFKFGDYSFEPHPWITPSQYLPPVWAEGVMVFDGETEFRVKRTYTAEILIDGIAWEMFAV
jgi:hypothetical protein